MRKHYHVLTGLHGCYMPDCNDIASSKRQALSLARYNAKQWNDSAYNDDRMVQRAPGVYVAKHNWIHVTGACTDDCHAGEY